MKRARETSRRLTRLYGRNISGRRDAAPQQRVRGVLRPGALARCALVGVEVQRG